MVLRLEDDVFAYSPVIEQSTPHHHSLHRKARPIRDLRIKVSVHRELQVRAAFDGQKSVI